MAIRLVPDMKVAYIVSMKSGMAAWNYREIDVLTRNGVDVFGFALTWTPGPYMPKPEWHFVKPSRLRTLLAQVSAFIRSPRRYLSLLGLSLRMRCLVSFLVACDFSGRMRKAGVEHIHCHFGDRKLFTGYFCSRMLDVPLTVTVHAYEILCNPNPAMFKLAAEHCTKVVTVSEFNKAEIHRVFGIPKEHIEVIHVHGDMSDGRTDSPVKGLIVASFTEKKGHSVLFDALARLDRDDIVIWIVGDGELDVRRMAERAGVSGQTVFLGMVGEDLLNILYEACDFFVLPSRTAADGDREGVPVSIMEAMSHRKPVIATRHAGIPELVPEILVEENDIDALADAIDRLADAPELRAWLGETNYAAVRRDFSDEAVLRLKSVFGTGR